MVNMWKLGTILWLAIGCSLIVFRKKFPYLVIQKQIKESATSRAKNTEESLQQLKELKFDSMFNKTLEIVAIVFGVFIIIMSTSEFFPNIGKYLRYYVAYIMLIFFAACVAFLVELKFVSNFLFKKVNNYIQNYYGNPYQKSRDLFKSNISDSVDSEKSMENDPVLRILRKKAAIYSTVVFIFLFVIFSSIILTIFTLTM